MNDTYLLISICVINNIMCLVTTAHICQVLQENVNRPSLIHEQDKLFAKDSLVMCSIKDKSMTAYPKCIDDIKDHQSPMQVFY